MNKHWDSEYVPPSLKSSKIAPGPKKESFWSEAWQGTKDMFIGLLFFALVGFFVVLITFWNQLPTWLRILTW